MAKKFEIFDSKTMNVTKVNNPSQIKGYFSKKYPNKNIYYRQEGDIIDIFTSNNLNQINLGYAEIVFDKKTKDRVNSLKRQNHAIEQKYGTDNILKILGTKDGDIYLKNKNELDKLYN